MKSVAKAAVGTAATVLLCGVQSGGPAAAEPVNWAAVAQCESGGNWAANTGNGAYGGLQIKPSTWEANGGVGSPATATPQQQVAVANRILTTERPGAWPSCLGQGRSRAPEMVPVGSLTHFLTVLADDAQGYTG